MTVVIPPFYLFLDFDGVLHSERGDAIDLFVHADRLSTMLAPYPEVQVIASSAWREVHHLTILRQRCGPILGPRLKHVTPIGHAQRFYIGLENDRCLWNDCRGPHLLQAPVDASLISTPYLRFAEIAMWLAVIAGASGTTPATVAEHALSRDDWAALDDTDFWFPPRCRQLIHVRDGLGLDDAHLAELEARLVEHRRRARRTRSTSFSTSTACCTQPPKASLGSTGMPTSSARSFRAIPMFASSSVHVARDLLVGSDETVLRTDPRTSPDRRDASPSLESRFPRSQASLTHAARWPRCHRPPAFPT